MVDSRKIRIAIFISFLLVFVLSVSVRIYQQKQFCMGLPVVSDEVLKEYAEVSTMDITMLLLNEKKAPVDENRNTIYIAQSADRLHHYSGFQGVLTAADPKMSLLLLDTPALDDIESSVANNVPFSLVMICGDEYQRINMIVTTFPVIRLEGEEIGNYFGNFSLFSGSGIGTDYYEAEESEVTWHIRGWSSRAEPKKSYKLTLLKENGETNDLSLLDLGSDDDWILNPMSRDDTFVKEMLTMGIWNQLAAKTTHNYNMSNGQYVELVINNTYSGLYLLQRRIDAKYLQLNESSNKRPAERKKQVG